jgi:tRNA(Arg) A34 adenosine deaminase TadA
MCARAIYWGNVRRVVFGQAESELLRMREDDPANPTMTLGAAAVFAAAPRAIELVGPALVEEGRDVHAGYWNR